MAQEKANLTLLLLKLLEEKDRYGYEIIETLAKRSDDTFCLKAGTLYPLLHGMEKDGFVTSYEKEEKEKCIDWIFVVCVSYRAGISAMGIFSCKKIKISLLLQGYFLLKQYR